MHLGRIKHIERLTISRGVFDIDNESYAYCVLPSALVPAGGFGWAGGTIVLADTIPERYRERLANYLVQIERLSATTGTSYMAIAMGRETATLQRDELAAYVAFRQPTLDAMEAYMQDARQATPRFLDALKIARAFLAAMEASARS